MQTMVLLWALLNTTEIMQNGISCFKSRIARRFIVLFLGCAFLPLTLSFVYSYYRVENQLYEQSMLRMENDCNVYGFALMHRLVLMDNLLQFYASYPGTESIAGISDPLRDQVVHMFVGLGLFTERSGLKTLSGVIDLEPDFDLFNQLLHKQGKPTIYISKAKNLSRAVYLLVPFTAAGSRGLLIAKPESSFLWGIGTNDMLPSMTELAIYDSNGELITATQISPGATLPATRNQSATSHYSRYEYQVDGEKYMASGWPLFLNSRFNAQTWTIILSGTRPDMLRAMLDFKRTFPLTILLVFWSILFLSLYFIRKTLTPLAILQQGTERVGNKDFNSRVEVNSGDEFEQLAESFNTMTSQLKKQFNTLALIDEIDRSILSSLDSSVIIPRSLRMISEFFSSQLIILAQRTPEDLDRVRLTILQGNHSNDLDEEYMQLSKEEKEILFSVERFKVLRHDTSFPFLVDRMVSDSYLCLPLNSERHVIGALILDFNISAGQDPIEQINQARQLADQLGIALANARLVSNLERLSLGTVEALARTVDAKSKWTAGHSERVADLAARIGRAMNWSKEQLEILFRSGLLHDIGKIGIPLAILDKPGKLTDEEYGTVKMHPVVSGKILEPIHVYKDILPLVVQHHERFDGKGYPNGLSGEEIDIGARILCVADVYDALISQRPYREGWTKEKVIDFMRENRGTMFDPNVIDVFLSMDIE